MLPGMSGGIAKVSLIVFDYWGAPLGQGNITLYENTVPAGKTWTVLLVHLLAEAMPNITPVGGDVTPYFQIDVGGGFHTILESSLETGNRVALQGQVAMNLLLVAGQKVRVQCYLRPTLNPPDAFISVSVVIQESP